MARHTLPQICGSHVENLLRCSTDVGSPTGHMALLARAFKSPPLSISGSNATQILAPGTVTVDANYNNVYEGLFRNFWSPAPHRTT